MAVNKSETTNKFLFSINNPDSHITVRFSVEGENDHITAQYGRVNERSFHIVRNLWKTVELVE